MGTLAILGDDDLQVRVFTSEIGENILLDRGEIVILKIKVGVVLSRKPII